MRAAFFSLPIALLALTLACTPSSEHDATPPESSTVEDTAVQDSDVQDSDPQDSDAECAEEGEACEIYEDYLSSCCNGRHTCFDAGCYYTEPE